MRLPQSVAEILRQHVTLEMEGIDRMYRNVYVPRLQIVEGVLGFLRKHRGHKVASTRLVEPITRQFVAAIERFVHEHGIPLVCFKKGQRKDELAAKLGASVSPPKEWSSLARPRPRAVLGNKDKVEPLRPTRQISLRLPREVRRVVNSVLAALRVVNQSINGGFQDGI